MSYSENEYEKAAIELFEELDYEHIYGPDVEDRDLKSPLYLEVLEESLYRLNPDLPDEAIEEALRKLTEFENAPLLERNRLFMDWLQNGLPVHFFDGKEENNDRVYLVDYEDVDNNSFIIANQWTIIEKSNKRPDILIFLNGLPIVVMELKSPSREETDVSDAYAQLRNYMQEIPSLFTYNAFLVISDLAISKAGTITSSEDRFMEWKTKDGSYENTSFVSYDTFFEGIFERNRLLDLIKNFILFMDGQAVKKIMAGYHQYFAVRKAIKTTQKAYEREDGKGGVFWHTQGSGKSLSMVFYAHLLQSVLESPTIVVITDRNDLDEQLFTQFSKTQKFLRQTPIQVESRHQLKERLKETKVNGIFFTTMQKFERSDQPLSQRRNIVVIVDEAHRGQYGLSETIQYKGKNKEEAVLKVGFARLIRNSLPHATYIGFTGTPISKTDKDTQEVFGNYIDIYDMTQAVEDGATRPIYYESRVLKLNLDESILAKIDHEYDRASLEADEETIEKSKKDLGQMEAILGNEKTIDSLVRDILDHYENHRENLLTGKAMIVAYSRAIAIKIYKRILELRPIWIDKVKVVMTESNKDPEEWREIIGNKKKRNELATEFKDDDSPFKIAIVVDMWLTGFDVPSLATMYIYKPMKDHNLMQAIARVNRVYKDKEAGLIVDYIGIASQLKKAMSQYTPRDKEKFSDLDIAKVAYPKFQEELEICQDLVHGLNYNGFFSSSGTAKAKAITQGVDFLLNPIKKDDLKDFQKHAQALKQSLSLCSSIVPQKQREEAAFFEVVRTTINRILYSGKDKKLSLPELNQRINDLLKQSIQADGVINLFSDKQKDFSLFDPQLLAEIAKMPEKNLAIEMLHKLLANEIKVYRKTNLVKSQKFSELMKKVLNAYVNGLITNEEVIQELLKLAQEIKKAHQEGDSLGLNGEELAFYDALTKPKAVKDFYTNEQLVSLTKELTEVLRKNYTIDWQRRESARAAMRVHIKRLLKKYKYPPNDEDEAVNTVLRQCELWADYQEDKEN